MNIVTVVALMGIALLLVAFALRRLWRAFISATDREIEKSLAEFRRQGLFTDDLEEK